MWQKKLSKNRFGISLSETLLVIFSDREFQLISLLGVVNNKTNMGFQCIVNFIKYVFVKLKY